ncbi:MAG: hypothetical protein K2I39_06120 [Muribaculaceae bacterium]|nr:hypothetical protein [Muribaculaceae bacterium]
MKKIITLALTALLIASSSCSNKKEEELRQQQALNEATNEELRSAVADRDQLLGLVNEISSGMDQIKQLENILAVNASNETPGQRDQIVADIAAIQQTLAQRRERLAELEKKLNSSSLTNSNLKKTISQLQSQIESQTREIETLRGNLDEAKVHIEKLNTQVDSLSTTVNNVVAERDSTDNANAELTNELNTCYYAIGNKNELKGNRIIETGFLRKTKIMESDFDQNFFTKADKRTLTQIDLNSTKAEILTNQPAGSYSIDNANGHKVLRITNPALFWSLSNYLVIKID